MACSTCCERSKAFDEGMMIFSLDVRRARQGDCLLLHYGTKEKPGLIMIDGGPRGVYGAQLKPRLHAIRKARGLDENKPLDVDLLMVSHVDDDHIQGVLDLTKELLEAKREHQPQFLQVSSLWHNSFDEIIDHKPDELTASVKRQFGPASVPVAANSPTKEKARSRTIMPEVIPTSVLNRKKSWYPALSKSLPVSNRDFSCAWMPRGSIFCAILNLTAG